MSSDSDIDEEDVEQLEALLARRFHRGKSKFKGKLPIICFNCNEVGHVTSIFPEKKNYRGGDKYKSRKMKTSRITKKEARNLATLLKRKQRMIIMNMMMKWCMLQ